MLLCFVVCLLVSILIAAPIAMYTDISLMVSFISLIFFVTSLSMLHSEVKGAAGGASGETGILIGAVIPTGTFTIVNFMAVLVKYLVQIWEKK